jgi:hypothetical protein
MWLQPGTFSVILAGIIVVEISCEVTMIISCTIPVVMKGTIIIAIVRKIRVVITYIIAGTTCDYSAFNVFSYTQCNLFTVKSNFVTFNELELTHVCAHE